MTNYRRLKVRGGSYFFTLVTYQRQSWLCDSVARQSLRSSMLHVRQKYPFQIDAMVLLPNHLHCIWTLPEGDADYGIRWSLIKRHVTQYCRNYVDLSDTRSRSRGYRNEGNFWQRRFWEHWIRDAADFQRCCDYIHMNPVRHGFCDRPEDWPYSSIHRFTAQDQHPNQPNRI
jgi:putative transposase